jgi:2-methylcitrate dehydratase PrpD
MGGHQSAPLVAPFLVVAEERRLFGAQLIQSNVVGVETEIRLARSVNFDHYGQGLAPDPQRWVSLAPPQPWVT